eukprot:GEMP01022133.1.p1 GENE.GEMP01022133.1~~GEMP01022133.1.p1  ORF type:complete len:567 (+),score=118.55 GEMP01022133.1:186-1886(+)
MTVGRIVTCLWLSMLPRDACGAPQENAHDNDDNDDESARPKRESPSQAAPFVAQLSSGRSCPWRTTRHYAPCPRMHIRVGNFPSVAACHRVIQVSWPACDPAWLQTHAVASPRDALGKQADVAWNGDHSSDGVECWCGSFTEREASEVCDMDRSDVDDQFPREWALHHEECGAVATETRRRMQANTKSIVYSYERYVGRCVFDSRTLLEYRGLIRQQCSDECSKRPACGGFEFYYNHFSDLPEAISPGYCQLIFGTGFDNLCDGRLYNVDYYEKISVEKFWGEWGSCSKTCGRGWRTRSCSSDKEGACPGEVGQPCENPVRCRTALEDDNCGFGGWGDCIDGLRCVATVSRRLCDKTDTSGCTCVMASQAAGDQVQPSTIDEVLGILIYLLEILIVIVILYLTYLTYSVSRQMFVQRRVLKRLEAAVPRKIKRRKSSIYSSPLSTFSDFRGIHNLHTLLHTQLQLADGNTDNECDRERKDDAEKNGVDHVAIAHHAEYTTTVAVQNVGEVQELDSNQRRQMVLVDDANGDSAGQQLQQRPSDFEEKVKEKRKALKDYRAECLDNLD